jgi:hypothetical protein
MATVADGMTLAEPAAGDTSIGRRNVAGLLYLPFCLLSLLPFLLIEHPPITDYANHVARLWVACHAADPAVAALYQYRLGIIPNLAVDLVNAPLCGTVSAGTVVRSVTAAALALIYFSAWLIQRKLFGQPNAFLLIVPAVAFNLVSTMGYVNFLAGVALVCLLVALSLGRERRFPHLLLLGNVGGLVLFFCHVFALVIALLFFFGLFLSQEGRSARGFVIAGLRTAAMFVLPLLLMPLVAQGDSSLLLSYERKLRLLPALFMSQHGNIGIHGLLLLSPLFWLMAKGRIALHPRLHAPLAVLGLYVLLAPSALQDAVDVDSRSLIPLAYLFFTGLQPVADDREIERVTATVTGVLIVLSLWLAGTVWVRFDRQVAEWRQAADMLPRHAILLTVGDDLGRRPVAAPMAYSHLASYATMDRQVFNPLEFTGVGMQPMAAQPRFAAVDTPAFSPLSVKVAARMKQPDPTFLEKARKAGAGFAVGWHQRFDYVLFQHHGGPGNFDPGLLTEVHRGSFFSILKINRSPVAPSLGARHGMATSNAAQPELAE